jgi:hypothetical protein
MQYVKQELKGLVFLDVSGNTLKIEGATEIWFAVRDLHEFECIMCA